MLHEHFYQGSRLLNDTNGFLGLSGEDWIAIALLLVGSSSLLEPFGWQILATPIAICAVVVLVPLRMTHRRKLIRDAIDYQGRILLSLLRRL